MPDVVPRGQGRRSPAGAPPPSVPRGRPGAGQDGAAVGEDGRGSLTVGQEIEVTITGVAQGGWCVAKPAGLPVLFVRHALPGEQVVARVTEVTAKLARADAVRILQPAPDRVEPPCPQARPGGCGGCDWQHAALSAQRALKAAVITQQLKRLAGLDQDVTVEPLPGDEPEPAEPEPAETELAETEPAETEPAKTGAAETRAHTPGLGWRTRVQFAVDRDGVAGLRGHRSHQVIDIGDCLIAHDAIRDLDIPGHDWSDLDWSGPDPRSGRSSGGHPGRPGSGGAVAVEVAVGGVTAPDNLAVTVVSDPGGARRPGPERNRNGRGNAARPGAGGQGAGPRNGSGRLPGHKRALIDGRPFLAESAAGRLWQVSADGFWQVHPAAAGTLSAAVAAALAPRPGDTVLDLYCGAGLFAGVVAPLVGPSGTVTGIESDPAAVRNARQNLSDYPWAAFRAADVAELAAADDLPPARLVIADPPRAGLAREVVDWLTGTSTSTIGTSTTEGSATGTSATERFTYVSCDPATLARDLALLLAGGWRLDGLRAFDAFPMTHHVECLAVLTRAVAVGE